MESKSAIADTLYGLISGTVRRLPADLSRTAISTLSTLHGSGPRRITDLAAAQHVTQPSMTVLVDKLQAAGYVERRGDPSDKRVSLVGLTDAGADYLAERRARGTAILTALVDQLDEEEVAALAAAVPALERLRVLELEERDPPGQGSGQH